MALMALVPTSAAAVGVGLEEPEQLLSLLVGAVALLLVLFLATMLYTVRTIVADRACQEAWRQAWRERRERSKGRRRSSKRVSAAGHRCTSTAKAEVDTFDIGVGTCSLGVRPEGVSSYSMDAAPLASPPGSQSCQDGSWEVLVPATWEQAEAALEHRRVLREERRRRKKYLLQMVEDIARRAQPEGSRADLADDRDL